MNDTLKWKLKLFVMINKINLKNKTFLSEYFKRDEFFNMSSAWWSGFLPVQLSELVEFVSLWLSSSSFLSFSAFIIGFDNFQDRPTPYILQQVFRQCTRCKIVFRSRRRNIDVDQRILSRSFRLLNLNLWMRKRWEKLAFFDSVRQF